MAPPPAPRTPLRRISQGSLFAQSRSGVSVETPHDLSFLEFAVGELADETDSLVANAEGMKSLSDSLATFNESFASFLYVMNMNALTVDWLQAPTDISFTLALQRAELKAKEDQLERARKREEAMTADQTVVTEAGTTTTYAADPAAATVTALSDASTGARVKKKGTKPKLTAKEKRERGLLIEKALSYLPLEFRGGEVPYSRQSSQSLRQSMETIIEHFLDRPNVGVKLQDLIGPPDLNQARVNKCLIALVNRKTVYKENSTGIVLYHWQGLPP